MMPNTPLRIDEIQRWPISILECSPYVMFIVDCDRVSDPHLCHGPANVIYAFLKGKLWCMDAYHDEAFVLVLLGPGADIAKRSQPVDASVGPEIDEDDFSAQS